MTRTENFAPQSTHERRPIVFAWPHAGHSLFPQPAPRFRYTGRAPPPSIESAAAVRSLSDPPPPCWSPSWRLRPPFVFVTKR